MAEDSPTLTPPPSRRRRLLRRAAVALAVLLVLLLLAPFIFTTALVRFALAHTGLRDLPVKFHSATLSPTGTLTLHDVTLPDAAESAGKPLLSAASVRVSFSWGDALHSKLRAISIDGLHATLRPAPDGGLTLLRPFLPAPSIPPATTTATAPAATLPAPATTDPPLWFDELHVTGTLHVDPFPALGPMQPYVTQIASAIPLHGYLKMSGPRGTPTREIYLLLGDENAPGAAAPMLAARMHLATAATTQLTIDALTLTNLAPALRADMLARLGAPPALQKEITTRLDSLLVAGGITFGADTALNLTVKLHDLSLRTAHASPWLLDRLTAATRVSGRLTATPLKDLTFDPITCAFDSLQVEDYRLTRALADVKIDASEISLADFQATLGTAAPAGPAPDPQLVATAAFDLNTKSLSRARLWLNNINAARALSRLPDSLRAALPLTPDGTLSARVFLIEADAEHIAARAELACPDQLTLTRAPSLPATWANTFPRAVILSNLNAAAAISWNFKSDAPPEIARGRLTLDGVDLLAPSVPGNQPLALTRVVSDFSFSKGEFNLQDLYANLPNSARLSASARYVMPKSALTAFSLSLDNVDALLINPWLPAPLSLAGQFDADVQGSLSPAAAAVTASVVASPESSVKLSAGNIAITGTPSPSISLEASADLAARTATLKSLTLHGLGSIAIDPALIASLQKQLTPDSTAAEFLDRFKPGAALAFEDLILSGQITTADAPQFSGNISLTGFTAGTPRDAENPLAVENVIIKATLTAPLSAAPTLAQFHISDAQLQAAKLTLGKNQISALSAKLAMADAEPLLSDIAFSFADGTFKGDAALSPDGLDRLHLNFKNLSQRPLTENLYPDTFTADGPISGTLALFRTRDQALSGTLTLDTDAQGKLKISRETSASTFAPAAKAAAEANKGSFIPPNFDQIVIDQLADYPYATGHVQLKDVPRGMLVQLEYERLPLKPGDPGYATPVTAQGQRVTVNPNFNFRPTLSVNNSLTNILKRLTGFSNALLAPPATTSRPAPPPTMPQ